MKLVLFFALLFSSMTIYTANAHEQQVAGIGVSYEKASEQQIKELIDSIIFSDEQKEILCRIVEAECTGQSIESKKNVVSVIVNRIHSRSFPDTIKEIVFQKDQFTPVSDKRYWRVEVTEETRQAVNEVLEDGVTTDALYFTNLKNVSRKMRNWFTNKLVFLFKDDSNHSFFKEKEVME